jgi:hypothetical protein
MPSHLSNKSPTSFQDIENRHNLFRMSYPTNCVLMCLWQIQSETCEISCAKGKYQDLDFLMKRSCVQNFKLANEMQIAIKVQSKS